MTDSPWKSVRAAAIYLDVAETDVAIACKTGALPASNRGTGTRDYFRIHVDELDAWARAGYPLAPNRKTA